MTFLDAKIASRDGWLLPYPPWRAAASAMLTSTNQQIIANSIRWKFVNLDKERRYDGPGSKGMLRQS